MSAIFLQILNLSISASYLVAAVLLLRLLFKKAPKWVSVVLWGIVGIRLIFPFSIESVLSLIPSAQPVSPTIMTDPIPTVNTGLPLVNSTINPILQGTMTPAVGESINPLQVWIPVLTAIWLCGVLAMLIYATVSYVRIKRKIGTAVALRENIYQSENVASPFVLGIIKPKIYLPFSLGKQNFAHVVAHEKAHIARRDHWWKPLGFLLLSIYWFHPLLWLGYVLLCRDIELACDEKVIKTLDHDARADYSEALLSCSVSRRAISACPLAFGEVGVKARIKSVLNYKKPAFWIIVVALVACVAVAVCFLTVPKSNDEPNDGTQQPTDTPNAEETPTVEALRELYPMYFDLDASNGLDVYVWQMAKGNYNFALSSHGAGLPLGDSSISPKSASAEDMKKILSTYNVTRDEITIIPWLNPLSSYIGDYWIIGDGEDMETKRDAYLQLIRIMLFGPILAEPFPVFGITDTASFDIDGDGVWETCKMSIGPTSGVYSYLLTAYEVGSETIKYQSIITPVYYCDHSFVCDADGTVKIKHRIYNFNNPLISGKYMDEYFDISIFNGEIGLIPTEDAATGKVVTLVYLAPALNYVTSEPLVNIRVTPSGLLNMTSGEIIADLVPITLDRTNFDNLMSGIYQELAQQIRKNVKTAYEVIPNGNDAIYASAHNTIGVFYVLEMKDGTTAVVYGHYDENGAKTNFIRWIFNIGNVSYRYETKMRPLAATC